MVHPIRDAAVWYVSLGLSAMPVRPNKKAVGKWKDFQYAVADIPTVEDWYKVTPTAQVAIVAGAVSGNLAVLDVDDPDYAEWVLDHMRRILERTWTVRTGSGKLHVYLRSLHPVESHPLSYGGTRRAECRGEGQYVLAPPSKASDDDHTGPYATLFGGPEVIWTVPDAHEFFTRMVQTAGEGLSPGKNGHDPQVAFGPTRILPPLTGEDAELLKAEVIGLNMSGKVTRCILEGPDRNEGDWDHIRTDKGKLDYSTIDWGVVASLVEAGLPDERIELVYATFPVGESCYRNSRRKGSFGSSYMKRTLDRARRNHEAEISATAQAKGDNFEIVEVVRVLTEPPHFVLTIGCPDKEVRVARGITTDDLYSETAFKKAIHSRLNFNPHLQAGHSGKNIQILAELISAMARTEAPAAGSTELDYLRAVIVGHLRSSQVLPSRPEDMSRVTVGWRDELSGHLYVRSTALVQVVASSVRGPTPKPERLWEALRPLGASDDTVHGLDGKSGKVWRLPLEVLDRSGL